MSTKIDWCDETINPIVGCTKVSPGCDHCYAEIMANRLANIPALSYKYNPVITNGKWNGKIVFDRSVLEKPKKWKNPRRIFITSMGDLFHPEVDFNDLIEILIMVERNPQHTFIMLTKRPHLMREFFTEWVPNPYIDPLPNLWLGVTAENQEQADIRIPILLEIPAAIHFISGEPLLGHIDIYKYLPVTVGSRQYNRKSQIDWVISGGENGIKCRDTSAFHIYSLFKQCRDTNTPFFFKGYGGKFMNKSIDGQLYNEFPKTNL